MLTLGQDNGQLRFGLMQAKADRIAAEAAAAQEAALAEAAPEVAPVAEPTADAQIMTAAFVPEKPLIATPAAEPVAAEAEGKLYFIASDKANVREGPGKDHAVIDSLPKGEAVLVISYGEGPEGWSHIRIEGDGLEGYVASRLLRE